MFANADERLWPGEFVNARLLVETRQNALVVPSIAVQRGPGGLLRLDDHRRQHGRNCARSTSGRSLTT